MLRRLILGLACLVGFAAVALGVRWLLDPAGAAEAAGMPLLEGGALSTQIGDLGALMFASGVFTLLGIFRGQPVLLYTPLLILATAAVFRCVAVFTAGAAFVPHLVGIEVVLCLIVFAAQRQLLVSGR